MLAHILYTNPILKNLDVSHNDFGSQTAREFGLALLFNRRLRKISLANCNLVGNGACESDILTLFEFVKVNRTLESFDISNNNINQMCCGIFRENMASNFSQTKKYKVDYSNSDYGLADCGLEGNSFSKADLLAISSYLQHNKALREVVSKKIYSD